MYLYDNIQELEKYKEKNGGEVIGLDASGDYDRQTAHYLLDDLYAPISEFRIIGDSRAEKLAKQYGAQYEKTP